MNIGGGEAADQLVRMMLSGSEVAVRLSGSGLKNMLALTLAHRRCHRDVLLGAPILLDLGCSLSFTGFSGLGRGLLPWRLLYLLWLAEVLDALEDHICSVDLRYRHDDVHHLAVTVRIPNGRE